jgi:hypothetical protein
LVGPFGVEGRAITYGLSELRPYRGFRATRHGELALDESARMRLSQPHVRAFPNYTDRPTPLHRFTAAVGVALVLLLTWLAADPTAHRALHAGEHDGCSHAHDAAEAGGAQTDEHGCVIAKFAHGQVEALVPPVVWAAPLAVEIATSERADQQVCLSPLHRLPPGCGPPVVSRILRV